MSHSAKPPQSSIASSATPCGIVRADRAGFQPQANPPQEVFTYLDRFAARCRSQRWFHALFHVDVLRDIAADLRAWLRDLRARAHRTETLELESDRELQAGVAELHAGHRPEAEEHFARADRLARRAANEAHDLGELIPID